MASITLPIDTDSGNRYELVGRWLATMLIIERTLELIIEQALALPGNTGSVPTADERRFWREQVAPAIPLDRKIRLVQSIVASFDRLPPGSERVGKRLQEMKELRNHLAHRLIGQSIDGHTVISDAYGNERRRLSREELEEAKRNTLRTYDLCAAIGTAFVVSASSDPSWPGPPIRKRVAD